MSEDYRDLPDIAPTHYRGLEVPEWLAEQWNTSQAHWWRRGVDEAQAKREVAATADVPLIVQDATAAYEAIERTGYEDVRPHGCGGSWREFHAEKANRKRVAAEEDGRVTWMHIAEDYLAQVGKEQTARFRYQAIIFLVGRLLHWAEQEQKRVEAERRKAS